MRDENITLTMLQKRLLDATAYAAALARQLRIEPRQRRVLRRLIDIGLVEERPPYALTPYGKHARTYWRVRRN